MMRRITLVAIAVLFIQAAPALVRWDGKTQRTPAAFVGRPERASRDCKAEAKQEVSLPAALKLGASGPAAAFAASPWTEVKGYPARAKWKMIFGLENVAFSWMEIFAQPHDSVHSGENVARGMAKGFVNAVGQTVGGALHAATAPATCLDIPLPRGGFQFD